VLTLRIKKKEAKRSDLGRDEGLGSDEESDRENNFLLEKRKLTPFYVIAFSDV